MEITLPAMSAVGRGDGAGVDGATSTLTLSAGRPIVTGTALEGILQRAPHHCGPRVYRGPEDDGGHRRPEDVARLIPIPYSFCALEFCSPLFLKTWGVHDLM